MDLFAALVALGRRWYLTLALIALVLGGTLVAGKAVKPDYKATASVILLAPSQSVKGATNLGNVNPYLGAGTPTFANVLSSIMSSDTTTQEVVHEGGTSTYTVGQGATANAPVIHIEATSKSPSIASKTASILISLINTKAAEVQAAQGSVPKNAYITTQTVTSGDKPVELQGSRTRVIVAVGAMGVVLTFGTVLLVDSWLMARRARRRRGRGRRGEDSGSGSGSGTDDAANENGSPSASSGKGLPLARVRP